MTTDRITPPVINPVDPIDKLVQKADRESDPNGIKAGEPGAKLDAGKPKAALLKDFGRALLEVAKVGTYGCKKYSRGGWKHVPDAIERYDDAMMRHWLAEGKELRDESGLLHVAQTAWNALAKLEKILEAMEDLNVEVERVS